MSLMGKAISVKTACKIHPKSCDILWRCTFIRDGELKDIHAIKAIKNLSCLSCCESVSNQAIFSGVFNDCTASCVSIVVEVTRDAFW